MYRSYKYSTNSLDLIHTRLCFDMSCNYHDTDPINTHTLCMQSQAPRSFDCHAWWIAIDNNVEI